MAREAEKNTCRKCCLTGELTSGSASDPEQTLCSKTEVKLTVIYILTQSRPRHGAAKRANDPVRSGPTGREGTRPYGDLLTRRDQAGSGPEIKRRVALRLAAVWYPIGNGENVGVPMARDQETSENKRPIVLSPTSLLTSASPPPCTYCHIHGMQVYECMRCR
jgi:hypothetical protein